MVNGPGETAAARPARHRAEAARHRAGRSRGAPTENGVTLFDASFPVVDLGTTGSIERALALAVTRQESAFNSAAVSPSGALGLMQLMPGTAREVAGRIGVPFIQDKLDARSRLQRAASAASISPRCCSASAAPTSWRSPPTMPGPAGWHAGSTSIGDPRAGKIDMVDWIEMIPFRETRNYVQRIMEGVGVYRDRLNGPFRTLPPAIGRS